MLSPLMGFGKMQSFNDQFTQMKVLNMEIFIGGQVK